MEAQGTAHEHEELVVRPQSREIVGADAVALVPLAVLGAVLHDGHRQVDLVTDTARRRGDGVEARLQRRQVGQQERRRRAAGRELLQHVQQVGQTPVTPILIRRRVSHQQLQPLPVRRVLAESRQQGEQLPRRRRGQVKEPHQQVPQAVRRYLVVRLPALEDPVRGLLLLQQLQLDDLIRIIHARQAFD